MLKITRLTALAAVVFVVTAVTALPQTTFAQAQPATPAAGPAAAPTPPADSTTAPAAPKAAPTKALETVDNPYGLEALWKGGDMVAKVTLAILAIYLVVVAVFTLVTLAVEPPLAQQARELGTRAPRVFGDLQDFLIEHRILTGRITFEEAVQRAPGSGGGQAVTAVWAALWSVIGGLFGIGPS